MNGMKVVRHLSNSESIKILRKEQRMTRVEMVCRKCIKLENDQCRLNPVPIDISDPDRHWCAKGQWNEWSERFRETEPFYWGEWDEAVQVN
jgi:hypothetical protein